MDSAKIISLTAQYALPVLFALVILLIGRVAAHKISRGVETGLNRAPQSDPSLSRFFASLLRYFILFAVVMAALNVIGVDTSALGAAIIGLGAAMAFILQGSLSNLAAGVMLLLFRPFKVGDEVEVGGETGVVKSHDLTATRLANASHVDIIIANSKIWGGTIKNFSTHPARRLDMNFGIDYNADIDAAIAAITQAAADTPRVHADPAPWAKVVNLGDSSVDIQLRAWCNASDYKALSAEISQPVKAALDKAGISIPYPHEIKIKQHVKHSKARDRMARLKTLREQKN